MICWNVRVTIGNISIANYSWWVTNYYYFCILYNKFIFILYQAFIIRNHEHNRIYRKLQIYNMNYILFFDVSFFFREIVHQLLAIVEFISWSKCNSSIFFENQWQIKAKCRVVEEFYFFRSTFSSHDFISMRKVAKLLDDCQMIPMITIFKAIKIEPIN